MAKTAISRAIKLFGTEVPDGKKRTLQAGPISAVLDNGAIRYIRYRGIEVLRGIAFLVRDKDWGTYPAKIEGLKVKQAKDGFAVSYTATCEDAAQGIRYRASITGKADGTVKFAATGTPLTDFLTNRTGFVVLHPLEGIVGAPVEITHTDGKKEKSRFPKFISPGQPVFEIRSLKHQVMPGVTATVLMEGNKFEMEDHRNWMDASYKTYVCSLLDPWPYTLKKDQVFDQSITVSFAGKPKGKAAAAGKGAIEVSLGKPQGNVPQIGVGVPMAEAAAAKANAALIAQANPSHLICQIDGRRDGQSAAASHFAALKQTTGRPVHLEIILPAKAQAQEEVSAIAAEVRRGGLAPDAIVVTQMHDLKSFQPNTPRPWGPTYEEMATAVRNAFPDVPVGGGMLSYFTELNRKPVPRGVFDFITHTVCPIVHAADDVSVMETLEALSSIFASTRNMIGKAPYHLGPSSIPCRDNPYGAAVASNSDNGRICLAALDPRQRGLFAAAWNVGLAAAAARAGLNAIALGAVTGPQGVIYRPSSSAQPGYDGTRARVYPAYQVLAGLCAAAGAKFVATTSIAGAKVTALGFQAKGRKGLWLANLTDAEQTVKISGLEGRASLRLLDAQHFAEATKGDLFFQKAGAPVKKTSTLALPPYAVALLQQAI